MASMSFKFLTLPIFELDGMCFNDWVDVEQSNSFTPIETKHATTDKSQQWLYYPKLTMDQQKQATIEPIVQGPNNILNTGLYYPIRLKR